MALKIYKGVVSKALHKRTALQLPSLVQFDVFYVWKWRSEIFSQVYPLRLVVGKLSPLIVVFGYYLIEKSCKK